MQKEKLPSKKIIEDALLKKALGYEAKEVVEEYVIDESGESKLSKKKITKKIFRQIFLLPKCFWNALQMLKNTNTNK